MSAELKVGDKAPAFTATAVGGAYGEGQEVALKALRGKNVVLYFYPKDDTPGCTKQACGLRDAWKDFAGKAEVFGVSIDSVRSHEKFIAKYELPFPLLSDEDHKIVEAYGVWVEKSMYGRKYWGAARVTFVIGKDGKVLHVFEKVKPEGHDQEVLAWLKEHAAA